MSFYQIKNVIDEYSFTGSMYTYMCSRYIKRMDNVNHFSKLLTAVNLQAVERTTEFLSRTATAAITDSVHKISADVPDDVVQFFMKVINFY